METDLKCNRLTCRTVLTEKAVVTTCSHIFCIDCANELFGPSQTCPACESSLTEPDDVVICSLHPTNDYKTSVLSGLSPALVLEISGRAISFWQYQIHQERRVVAHTFELTLIISVPSLFQAAILKNVNERNAHLQKQLDNVVREANSELTLLNNKLTGIERDLELERRKTRDLMDSARERDKEYQKLKASLLNPTHFISSADTQYDNLKRKTILAPSTLATAAANEAAHQLNRNSPIDQQQQHNQRMGNSMTDIAGGMDANRVQRTPLRHAQASNGFIQQPTRMGMGNQQFPLQRRATTTAASRAFNPRPSVSVSVSGSEIDAEEDPNSARFQRRASGNGPSIFQSVAGGTFAKARNAPRVVAQPTAARQGAGGFRPAGAGFGH